jgi:hypothetical protein
MTVDFPTAVNQAQATVASIVSFLSDVLTPTQAQITAAQAFVDPSQYRFRDGKRIEKRPNFLEKVKNFGKAMYQHFTSGGNHASNRERDRRLMICKHPACGCSLARKTVLKSSKCPIDKW